MARQPAAMVRVMIVEDDADTRERFAHAISSDSRTTLAQAVSGGREAIARLPAARPEVLLVDLGLPDVHGIEVIRHAERTLGDCDIMVITVFGDERNVLESIEAGATGYVLKDCSDSDLVEHVLDLHAGGAPMSPGIARMVLKRLRARGEPRPEPGPRVGGVLTAREADVLRLISRGYMYAEIAAKLELSPHTVGSHVKSTYRKLAVHSAVAAVMRATQLRLLDKP
jgi:DNA-binding NarL/FixJ family response regulator